ncbi:MAG: hypothetical protein LUD74_08475, partial [Tannerellaceae bacterium]|nr:hypothetical protein [Tannerellaceae bacterium]
YKPASIPPRDYKPVRKKAVPSIPEGKTALFYDPEFHATHPGLEFDIIGVKELGELSSLPYKKVIVTGNSLPLFTKEGKSIKKRWKPIRKKEERLFFTELLQTPNPKKMEPEYWVSNVEL